jgi:hypothetical protein
MPRKHRSLRLIVQHNAILSFGKRTESHGAKFSAFIGHGTIFV